MLGNQKGKRSFSLAQQMNEAILDTIKSINADNDSRIVAVRCRDCHEMVAMKDYPTHECTGGAA